MYSDIIILERTNELCVIEAKLCLIYMIESVPGWSRLFSDAHVLKFVIRK